MKIIVPVLDNGSAKNYIAHGFHNAEYVCIYDTETKISEWLPTSEISKETGNITLALKNKGIMTIISNHMPSMALDLFSESGLKVYKAKSNSLSENLELFNQNLLPQYTSQLSFESGCSGSCSSCGSSCS